MLKLRRGVVVAEDPLTVEIDGEARPAWADHGLVGEVREGDEVVVVRPAGSARFMTCNAANPTMACSAIASATKIHARCCQSAGPCCQIQRAGSRPRTSRPCIKTTAATRLASVTHPARSCLAVPRDHPS